MFATWQQGLGVLQTRDDAGNVKHPYLIVKRTHQLGRPLRVGFIHISQR